MRFSEREWKLGTALLVGSHRDYDGDNPWWTLRFSKELDDQDLAAVAALLGESDADLEGNFEPLVWQSAQQCQWVTVDPWFESQAEWEGFYMQVESALAEVHEEFPLLAIFFQEGQLFEGTTGSLLTMTDEQLTALASS